MRALSRLRLPLACAVVASSLPLAAAETAQPGPWDYRLTIYGYFPKIGGTTTFPTGVAGAGGSGGSGSSGDAGISVSADQLIDALKFTFMGSFDVHNGSWGVLNDVIYLDLGQGKSQSRDLSLGNVGIPANVNANLNLDLKGWVWTVAGEYRTASAPGFTMDVLAGARYFDLKQTLKYEFTGDIASLPLPGRAGSSDAKLAVWDGIVGVKGRFAFGDRHQWSVPFYLDGGAGQSKSTWQAATGIGYAFKWGEVLGMWRYLDYRFESAKHVHDVNFNGPMIGAMFHW